MPFLLVEILNYQGQAHLIGVGNLSNQVFKYKSSGILWTLRIYTG